MTDMDVVVPTPEKFVEEIEDLVYEKDISYMEAIVEWCTRRGVDTDFAGTLVKKAPLLKSRVQKEAEALNFLPKTERLPF
jgi:hypothetical protein